MESGTLPPPPMLLHSNDSFPAMSSSHSPMNQYSDIFASKHSANTNTKTTKRKFDDIIDPAAGEFDSAGSALKPQKTDQQNVDPERSLSRTGTPLSNGSLPAPSSALSRNDNDNGPPSYEFSAPNNNVNTGRSTPNSSLLSQPTPPPPSLQQQQQQQPPPSQQQGPPSAQPQQSMPPQQQPTMPPLPPSSSYMPMSPRNQYNLTSDSPFLQTNNQVFVFTTQLANEAAEAVMKNEYPNIVEYHKSLPNTAQFLSSISNNMNHNHNPMMGGMMHPNQGPPPPGCHSPRTMQMMMNGAPPPHHNPHLVHHNGNGGPPPNWPHPHFHPHQQQPSFGRLTPGSGGLPPPGHLLPPGAMLMNGSSPPPGMRGMPPMPGMGPMPSDSTENLTPDQVKRRKNQLNKIEDLKTKITGGRARGGRAKANAAAMATPAGGIPPPVNGLPPPPGALDPHQQQMMMMNSPHGVGPPHHMMGMVPPPPHMLPPGMRGPPDGMMMEMNGPPPPHGYMNGPMPPGYHHGQYGPGPGPGPNDPYGQMLPPHQQNQAMRDWNKMQIDHLEGKGPMRGQPPPYSSVSPSSLTPPIATTSSGGGPNSNHNSGKLLSPKMEPSSAPRLYKVGQPEKFIPDALPSANKKLPGAVGEVQMTSSPSQMDYNDLGMDGEELIITRHLNQAYRLNNNGTGNSGQPLPSSSSSSSSCKDEPMTPSQRSTSTPNHIANTLSSGKPPAGSTTPTHLSQGPPSHLSSQNASVASPRSSKLNTNSSLASPLMLGNPNSASKDDPLDMNGGPRTPTSNMAPPLSSMLQMTNSLQSAGSPYNPSNNSSMGSGMKSSSGMSGNGPPMVSPNLGHMSKSIDQLPPSSHMPLPPPHPQMHFQNMNPHHRMLGPHEPMPPHFHPPGGNFGPPPPGHPHMYKMRPPHHGMDPSGMMMPHPGGGPMRSSKGLPPPPSDHMQAHHLPPPHYQKMSNMDPHLGGPPPGHPQQHMRFGPMMDDGFNMGPPPPSHHPHHPHMHPHMHPHGPPMHHHPMHPNDGRLPPPQGPPPPQAINNTYVSTTMSIQQLNIQSVGPGGGPADLQSGTIHYHAPSGNGLDCPPPPGGPPGSTSNGTMFSSQQQFTSMTHIPGNDPSYQPQFNDLQPLPPNLSMDGVQPSNYW